MPEISTEVLKPNRSEFTPQQKELLANKGFWFMPVLRGLPLNQMNEPRFHVLGLDSNNNKLTSGRMQVAVNPDPDVFLLKGSSNKTLDEQLQMVADFSKQLEIEILG